MPGTLVAAEKMLRATLWEFGVRFRTNEPVLGTAPTITITNCKVAIFVQDREEDRCPWHTTKKATAKQKKDNAKHWKALNTRDAKLRKAGWTVVRVWQHEIEATPRLVAGRLSLIVRTVRKVMLKNT